MEVISETGMEVTREAGMEVTSETGMEMTCSGWTSGGHDGQIHPAVDGLCV